MLALILLSGCATTAPRAMTTRLPACEALIGPIQYNSANPRSDYYAASKLSPQLRQRNAVGRNLNCPEYQLNRW